MNQFLWILNLSVLLIIFPTELTWMILKILCHFLVLAFCIPWVVQTFLQPSCTSDSLLELGSTTRSRIWHLFPSQIGLWLSLLDMELLFQWLTGCWKADCTCKENHTTHYFPRILYLQFIMNAFLDSMWKGSREIKMGQSSLNVNITNTLYFVLYLYSKFHIILKSFGFFFMCLVVNSDYNL